MAPTLRRDGPSPKAMNATALQNLLGLYAIAPKERIVAELLLALTAALVALATRRGRHIMRPAGFSMIAAGFVCDVVAQSVSHLPVLANVFVGLALVFIAWGVIRILLDGADATVRRRRHHFSTIFKDLLMLLLFALVVAVVLRVDFKVNVAPLLATSAVLTVVLGFALQETLGNIFSGLTLQLEKPFEPGDWIRSANHLGRVQGIGWRSTKIVTFANERLDIPNALLAKDVLVNYANEHVADEILLGISYLEPPNRVREVILGAMRDIPGILHVPAPEVYAWEYGESAIRYRIRYWLADYGVSEDVRDRMTTALWYVLRRHGMEIPFPIRTLELRQVRPDQKSGGAFERELAYELRQVDFLRDLTDEELTALAVDARVHQFGVGETLVRQNDAAESFFILRRGVVEVIAETNDGTQAHIADLRPPAIFGEIALMTGEPRNSTVRARSDVEVLEMGREAFTRLFRDHPELASKMGDIIAARISERQDILSAVPDHAGNRARRNWLLSKMRAVFDF